MKRFMLGLVFALSFLSVLSLVPATALASEGGSRDEYHEHLRRRIEELNREWDAATLLYIESEEDEVANEDTVSEENKAKINACYEAFNACFAEGMANPPKFYVPDMVTGEIIEGRHNEETLHLEVWLECLYDAVQCLQQNAPK